MKSFETDINRVVNTGVFDDRSTRRTCLSVSVGQVFFFGREHSIEEFADAISRQRFSIPDGVGSGVVIDEPGLGQFREMAVVEPDTDPLSMLVRLAGVVSTPFSFEYPVDEFIEWVDLLVRRQ